MIKLAIKLTLYGLIALLMPLLVHAEEIEEKDLCLTKEISFQVLENSSSGYINANGTLSSTDSTTFKTTDFIEIEDNYIYFDSTSWDSNLYKIVYYDTNKAVIYDEDINPKKNIKSIPTMKKLDVTNAKYIRFSYINRSGGTDHIIRYYKFCTNNNNNGGNDMPTDNTPTPIQQTYINLGILGVGLLFAIFIIGGRK